MSTISMVSHKPFQRLQPLSLLAQLISRQVNGCLEVVSEVTSWLIYLNHGKLCFATSSIDPFERLDRHLHQLGAQSPALTDEMAEARSLFEGVSGTHPANSADYQAICWLVEHHGLDRLQATSLIEALAKEVIESFLSVTEGIYEITNPHNFTDYPSLCQLDFRPIVESCYNQRRQQPTVQQAPPSPNAQRAEVQRASGAVEQPQTVRQSTASAATNRSKPVTPVPAAKTCYTIACIDDSPTILQAIGTFLDDASFSVLMINDPVKALMQVMRSKPDVILLDVGMPNLDGYELCSLLRRHPNFKNTPIIMVTGHTGFIDRARAKLVGASGYLTKPFTQSELLKAVFKHLT